MDISREEFRARDIDEGGLLSRGLGEVHGNGGLASAGLVGEKNGIVGDLILRCWAGQRGGWHGQ